MHHPFLTFGHLISGFSIFCSDFKTSNKRMGSTEEMSSAKIGYYTKIYWKIRIMVRFSGPHAWDSEKEMDFFSIWNINEHRWKLLQQKKYFDIASFFYRLLKIFFLKSNNFISDTYIHFKVWAKKNQTLSRLSSSSNIHSSAKIDKKRSWGNVLSFNLRYCTFL